MDEFQVMIHRPSGDTLVTYSRDKTGKLRLVSELPVGSTRPLGPSDYLPDGRIVNPPPVLDTDSLPVAPTDEKSLVEQYIGIVVEKLRLGGEHCKVTHWELPWK